MTQRYYPDDIVELKPDMSEDVSGIPVVLLYQEPSYTERFKIWKVLRSATGQEWTILENDIRRLLKPSILRTVYKEETMKEEIPEWVWYEDRPWKVLREVGDCYRLYDSSCGLIIRTVHQLKVKPLVIPE